MTSSAVGDIWDALATEAVAESPLWAEALRPEDEREREPVFSPLAEERFALGLETIYEGYLVHYGTPRLFAPEDGDAALLLGDYLYAHGLVRIAAFGEVRRGRGSLGADLALQPAARRGRRGRRAALGGDGRAARHRRRWTSRGRRCACAATRPRSTPQRGRPPATMRSRGPSPRTACACGRVAVVAALFHLLAARPQPRKARRRF